MAHVTESMRAAARENGKQGGRPQGTGASWRAARDKRIARKQGERGAFAAVEFLCSVMAGRVAGLGPEHRIAAARDLMDRFGFPRLAQQQHFGEFPTKLFDLTVAPKPDAVPATPPGNGDDRGNGAEAPLAH